jgi:hypothetical protein
MRDMTATVSDSVLNKHPTDDGSRPCPRCGTSTVADVRRPSLRANCGDAVRPALPVWRCAGCGCLQPRID